MTIDWIQHSNTEGTKMGGVQMQTLHIILILSFCLTTNVLAITSSAESIPNLESATTEISSPTETTLNLESATTVYLVWRDSATNPRVLLAPILHDVFEL